jgi:hypothetical protein
MKRFQKRSIVAWVRFARRHRESNILPVVLFLVLFIDGFIVMLPSMIFTGVAVTISPRRWWLFAVIFVTAAALNNYAVYWVGMLLPAEMIWSFIEGMGLESVYESAEKALGSYGPWAALVGAAISLPTQMITLLVGMADAQSTLAGREAGVAIGRVLFLATTGHLIKMLVFCSVIRYGWVRLEAKVLQELNEFGNRFR